jgi:sugar/nucleoside kinase (ribokinase family)
MSKVIGMGNALVDVMTILKSEKTLQEFALPKGSMQLVSKEFSNRLLAGTLGLQKKQSSGGSAANTIHGLANLGIETGFVGKVGKDNLGQFFERDLKDTSIKPILFHDLEETGRSIALISKDSERTMATYLGAAVDLHEEDITSDIFKGYDFFHIEGYLVQSRELIRKSLRLAKSHGLTVSIDMASFNVVADNRDFFEELINEYVDIVLANESEAKSLTGEKPDKALSAMASMADVAVIKLGKKGSLVKRGPEEHDISIEKVKSIDSTGAGDLYAAGFIYGLCTEQSLETSGKIGAILGAHITEVIGAKMDDDTWHTIREKIKEICCN